MKLMTFICTLLCGTYAFANSQGTDPLDKRTITVFVPNIVSNKGLVIYSLYGEDGFVSPPIQNTTSYVIDRKSKVVFRDVSPGEYAIVCYHDANTNGRMDFSPNGRALEDYGVSNNPMSYGRPEYETAKFIVSQNNVTLEIKF